MSATIEIAYYNTFILSGGETEGTYHVEESRIRGGFNNKSVDFGVRAFLVDDEYSPRIRNNAMIYSGIFNAKTKVNNTNQFSLAENITKAVDVSNGSIQKLFAEDTNLIIFQENKDNKALIDKDAIYTAEGSPLQASTNIVIGQIVPFSGKYGISKNPESFAVYGNRKYFADKNRGLILRLSSGAGGGDGITPISDAGMRNFFNDNLRLAERIYGMYDESKQKYVISLQGYGIVGNIITTKNPNFGIKNSKVKTTFVKREASGYKTLSFGEKAGGWASFYTYKPTFGFSLTNKFYTFYNNNLWEHYRLSVPRCKFYGSSYSSPASIEFLMNDQPNAVKTFLTIGYEGSSKWKMLSAETDSNDKAWPVLGSDQIIPSSAIPVQFFDKENKYYGHLRNNTTVTSANQVTGIDLAGIKGYVNKIKMEYWKPEEEEAFKVKKAELFAVDNEIIYSSQ